MTSDRIYPIDKLSSVIQIRYLTLFNQLIPRAGVTRFNVRITELQSRSSCWQHRCREREDWTGM